MEVKIKEIEQKLLQDPKNTYLQVTAKWCSYVLKLFDYIDG